MWVGSLSREKLFNDLSPAQFDLLVKVLSLPSIERDFRYLLTSSNLIQSQGMTSKVAIKVSKRHVLRVEGKKIKNELSMLIQVLEESRRIWDVF